MQQIVCSRIETYWNIEMCCGTIAIGLEKNRSTGTHEDASIDDWKNGKLGAKHHFRSST